MKRGTRWFLLVMLLYALLFSAALLLFIRYFDGMLAAYEASRTGTVVERFFDTLGDDEIDGWTAGTVGALNTQLMPEDECRARLRAAVRAAERVRSGDNEYLLLDCEHTLGRLTLVPAGQDRYGFTEYRVESADFDFSHLCGSARYTVPADWTVLCNGVPLGADRVADRELPYALLEEFYGNGELSLPYLWVYDTGLFLEEPETVFLDGEGRPVEELSEERFCDNCSEADAEELRTLAGLFVERYLVYSTSGNRNTRGNYYQLEKLLLPGSSLQKRLRSAMQGLGIETRAADRLQEIEYLHLMDLKGSYLCDLRYTAESRQGREWVPAEHRLKLIAVRTEDGKLLAAAMSTS